MTEAAWYSFHSVVSALDREALRTTGVDTVMLNLGPRCTLSCSHCHVCGSPERTEAMDDATIAAAFRSIRALQPSLVDITGGAPELHPRLRDIIAELRVMGIRTRVRTNLHALLDPASASLPRYLADAEVELFASMPGPSALAVDHQRGTGVHDASLEALWRLNALGYGTRLRLDLVHNPDGPRIPESRELITRRYRAVLSARGIAFHDVVVIANVPVGRFADSLRAADGYDEYVESLRAAFNQRTLRLLECRQTLEIGWDGTLWDCDFNLGAGLPAFGVPTSIHNLDLERLVGRDIAVGDHCFACTAAFGSG